MIRFVHDGRRQPAFGGPLRPILVDRDVVGLDDLVRLGQHRHVLDDVLQLAHVAAPGPRTQEGDARLAQLGEPIAHLAVALPIIGEEMIGEEGDVFQALAQRRQLDRHHAQAVEQVAPQDARIDRFLRVAVGGGDEPHVHHGVLLLGAHPPHHAILDDAQQLGLEGLRHLGELVQEEGAAVGGFEQAGLVAVGAGKGPLAVAEHLGLEQRLGQGGAVDGHDAPAGAAAVLVNELRDHFLAGATLAADEHRGVGGGHLPGQLHRLAEQRRDADQGDLVAVAVLLHELEAEVAGFPRHHHRVRRPPDQHLEVGGGKRLGQVIPGPGPQRLDAAGDAGVASHHDDDGIPVVLQRRPQDVHARGLGHVQVDEDDVELAALDRVDRLLAAADQGHVVAVHLEHAGAALAQGALVVHYKDADARLDLGGNRQRVARPGLPRGIVRAPGVVCERGSHGGAP